jgi:hypothetical protein
MKRSIPLTEYWVGGIKCPLPAFTIQVRDRYGLYVPMLFRIDTAADFSTILASIARDKGLPFREHAVGRVRGLAGVVERYRDRIHVNIADREYDWPCDFLRAPVSASHETTGHTLPPVLGRAGFLDEFGFCMDPESFTLTRLGPLRRWWRQCVHRSKSAFGRYYSPEVPL